MHSNYKHVITPADAIKFAELSGDWNPIHVDPVAARRSAYGGPIAHGLHLALMALELHHHRIERPLSIRCRFVAPISIGKPFSIDSEEQPDAITVKISDESTTCVVLTCRKHEGAPSHEMPRSPHDLEERRVDPAVLGLDQIDGMTGALDCTFDHELAQRLFPDLCKQFTYSSLGEVLACTRLVGMHCPGLHSIFYRFDAHLNVSDRTQSAPICLTYESRMASRSLRMAEINASGRTVRAHLSVFVRPEPVIQPSYRDVSRLVEPGEFHGVKALVVGGSRGMGEIAAKIISAGGGEVDITYSLGLSEATETAEQIASDGGKCTTRKLDLTSFVTLSGAGPYNQLYCMGTPTITRQKHTAFDEHLYAHLKLIYVDAVERLIRKLSHNALRPFGLFIPSTAFLDHPEAGFHEYCRAKLDSEDMANRLLAEGLVDLVSLPRLSRVRTDQTSALPSALLKKAPETLLPLIRDLHRRATVHTSKTLPERIPT